MYSFAKGTEVLRNASYIAVQDGNLKFALENKLIVADGDDMLKPLKTPEGETEKICIPVDALLLEHIKFNQEAYDQCGQFTVVLVDSITGEEVAGAVFNFLDAEEMQEMGENQAKLKALTKKLKRRKGFEDWDYGEMHGRRAGTVWVLDGELFQDIERILSKLELHVPSVVNELKELGRFVNVLGSHGVVAFNCWNYIAPQHTDKDGMWTVSYQLQKKGCGLDEFGFAFSQWGKVLETRENCVW
ncbi:hypothetical protein BJ138DRAFT_1120353 [Hygrophoropsis aurantiaca]|uniref:Uncharacterized protein n=1 Tax=Hygrophoropsis aurantiaca TaxID=72124 RepID=A0ACB7ZS01_9AGAM|nr:hypothetical protein BJ138DRAFT_1120353 [Hygrophoropsis aurantiaca]